MDRNQGVLCFNEVDWQKSPLEKGKGTELKTQLVNTNILQVAGKEKEIHHQ